MGPNLRRGCDSTEGLVLPTRGMTVIGTDQADSDRVPTVTEFDDVKVFEDDDAGYLDWIATHPGRVRGERDRPPTAGYVVLHRAACRTISGAPTNGRVWTVDYLKACSDDGASIGRWVREATRWNSISVWDLPPLIGRQSSHWSTTQVTVPPLV